MRTTLSGVSNGNSGVAPAVRSLTPPIIENICRGAKQEIMNLKENYIASAHRYDDPDFYRRCGHSGVLLPKVSLGFWQNFGATAPYERSRAITHYAFDHGVTHFDLANNYGPPYGTAEETMGRLMDDDFRPYRDELFIASKAGYDMWPGPYGNWGSRKYLMASLEQSLRRMHLDYVDLFYSHRYDPLTPLEETLQALVDIVRQGKALYIGISRWPLPALKTAVSYLRAHDTPLLIYQGRLNLIDQAPRDEGILDYCREQGVGFISFSPLAQGLLTDRYLHGIPADSRMARHASLTDKVLTPPHAARRCPPTPSAGYWSRAESPASSSAQAAWSNWRKTSGCNARATSPRPFRRRAQRAGRRLSGCMHSASSGLRRMYFLCFAKCFLPLAGYDLKAILWPL